MKNLNSPSREEILRVVDKFRPSRGGTAAQALRERLGATHVGGCYALTDEPFLIEGARAIHEQLGWPHLKLWFCRPERAYPWNSDWKLPAEWTLAQLAAHPYYRAAWDFPFASITLEVQLTQRGQNHPLPPGWMIPPDLNFDHERTEIRDLGIYLLETYRDRDVTFLLQNWEGDWMLRGLAGADWSDPANRPHDLEERVQTFIRWTRARQAGVDDARSSVTDTRCRLLHAVEVNRVLDSLAGIPTLTTDVLPSVEIDLVSWSAYDGMSPVRDSSGDDAAVGMWQGLDIIKSHARTRERGMDERPQVMIGEFGIPEMLLPPERDIEGVLDGTLAAALAHDCPLLHYWEIYCNEPQDPALKSRPRERPFRKEELMGFWLIKPDGSRGRAASFFDNLIPHKSL